MKLTSIEIKNYKCLKHIIISNIGGFHSFIGANGSGKTSLLELAQILKLTPNTIEEAVEIVSGKVDSNDSKTIEWILTLELSSEEQQKFYHYLKLPDEEEIKTIMQQVKITFSMKVSNNNRFGIENQILLTEMKVSDTANQTFIPLLSLKNPEKMMIEVAELDTQLLQRGRIANNPFVNDHLRNSPKTETNAKGYYTSKPSDSLPYSFVQFVLSNLRFVPAFRHSEKIVESKRMESESPVSDSGSNVIQFIHTLYQNNRKRFDHISEICKRIFPEILDIHPYQIDDNKYTIAVEKLNLGRILLQHEASGLDQLLIILWKIESSPPGTIWFIDEPELHLHPGAQKALYEFFVDQQKRGKQILIGTHSLIFIHKSPPDEISILFNKESMTRTIALNKLIEAEQATTREREVSIIRKHVFEALGYDPEFGFEAKNIVVVEGKTDKKILLAFAHKLDIALDTLTTFIIPFGNKRNIEKYSPVLAYTLTGKKCLIVLDNDRKNPSAIKEKIMLMEKEYKNKIGENIILTDSNFYLFPENVYSIEYYLLEPRAIYEAANQSDSRIMNNISNTINDSLEQLDKKMITPKELLISIWETLEVGSYHQADTAEQIAKKISREHLGKYLEIAALVNSMVKP